MNTLNKDVTIEVPEEFARDPRLARLRRTGRSGLPGPPRP